MPSSSRPLAPRAHLTLRAHQPSPARVELIYNRRPYRLARTLGWLALCWGSIPLLLWVPPHYPWVSTALVVGAYLAYRSWTGRYAIHSFAGICPRCGSGISLGSERTVDLPHTLTCFNCHFEPRLEVDFGDPSGGSDASRLEHRTEDCVGVWEGRWLADERFIYCAGCHGGAPATDELWRQAEAENVAARLLERLTNEGRPLI